MFKSSKIVVFSILASMGATSAFAALPAVGDMAETEYSKVAYITVAGKAKRIEAVSSVGKVEIASFDSAKNEFTMKRTTTAAGASVSDTYTAAQNTVMSDAELIDMLTDCAKQGGVAEKVTVPAGQFDACTVSRADDKDPNTVYKTSYSYVPFGIVYQETQVSGKVTGISRLKSFKMQD